jgi:hypothetical protein
MIDSPLNLPLSDSIGNCPRCVEHDYNYSFIGMPRLVWEAHKGLLIFGVQLETIVANCFAELSKSDNLKK